MFSAGTKYSSWVKLDEISLTVAEHCLPKLLANGTSYCHLGISYFGHRTPTKAQRGEDNLTPTAWGHKINEN